MSALRPFCAAVLIGAAGCASSGITPGTVEELNLVGTWNFDVVLGESIRGVVTFTAEDRYVVQCIDDTGPPNPPMPLSFRAGRLQWNGCGAEFRTFRDDDGVAVSEATRTLRVQVHSERVCTATETTPTGAQRCIAYGQRPVYRDTRVSDRIRMERVVTPGGR